MMKIVPARRRVTEASVLPPASIDRRRAIKPDGCEVADGASITAKATGPRAAGLTARFGYQHSVKKRCCRSVPGAVALIQIDVELVGAVASDQRQFKRRAFRVGSRRYA